VVGFLGGRDYRKGYDRVVAAIARTKDAFLLAAGPGSEETWFSELEHRQRWCGHLDNVEDFLAALDVLLVPSRFEPFGLVCLEAAAAGVPVIATDEVGALPTVLQFGAGLRWNSDEPIAPLLATIMENEGEFGGAARQMATALTQEGQGRRLLDVYERVYEVSHTRP
jgi:glycogen(starch) synthase